MNFVVNINLSLYMYIYILDVHIKSLKFSVLFSIAVKRLIVQQINLRQIMKSMGR